MAQRLLSLPVVLAALSLGLWLNLACAKASADFVQGEASSPEAADSAAEARAAQALLEGSVLPESEQSVADSVVSCGSVRYRPLSESERQAALTVAYGAIPGPQLEAPLPSPQQSMQLISIRLPDFRKPKPWNTVMAVNPSAAARSAGARPWTLSFANHGNIAVSPRWLNEKLLFARSWASHRVSFDWLFDAETGQLLYAEEAEYSVDAGRCS